MGGSTKDEDRVALLREREDSMIPLSKTPFRNDPVSPAPGEKGFTAEEEEELRVSVAEEVGWIDLLLELAMTTAFANIADNSSIATGNDVTSYIAFFTLVWWIWASQVAYNMRFRQGDWFHRAVAFCMLILFSAMAAFTNNFDISSGIAADNGDKAKIEQIVASLGGDAIEVQAAAKREERLPLLNARGISLVMGFSRLLLIVQYSVVLYYARRFRRHALFVHLGSMVISMALFFAAFIVMRGDDVTRADEIVKVVLWYTAIVLEIGAHFLANEMPGHVSYSGEAVFARASTLFIVVLGIGLDKITGQFRFVVGTLGFGAISVGSLLSVAVILIGYFSLYFGGGETIKKGNHRALVYFFAHLPFMAGLIVLLRGVASLVSFVNFTGAMNTIMDSFLIIFDKWAEVGGNLLPEDVAGQQSLYDKAGLSLPSLIDQLNKLNLTEISENPRELYNSVFKIMLEYFERVLKQYDAAPDEESLTAFRYYDIILGDSKTQDPNVIFEFMSDILQEKLTPATWFMGLAGSTMFLLGILMFLRTTPRDRYEWAATAIRLIFGTILMSFSFFNLKNGRPVLTIRVNNETGEIIEESESPSVIWKFADSGWMLPSLAITLIIVNLIGLVITILGYRYSKNRTYHVPQGNQARPNFLTMAPNFQSSYGEASTAANSTTSMPHLLMGVPQPQSKPKSKQDWDPYAMLKPPPASLNVSPQNS